MDKIALVTGSSRGIGRAVARRLAAEGYAVCVNYRVRQDCAMSLVSEITAAGSRAMAVQADVAHRVQVNEMVRRVEGEFGPVSLLVNNAGVAGQALFQDITDALWHRYFSVNVDGAFHAIQAVLPHMLHEHAGCIVNVSSIWGLRGASCEVTYSATKGALIALTRSLASELAPTGIRVNCVAPGVIKTDMLDALPPEVLPQLAQETPLGRPCPLARSHAPAASCRVAGGSRLQCRDRGISCGSMTVPSSAVSARCTHSTGRGDRPDSVRLHRGDRPQPTTCRARSHAPAAS